MAIAFYKEYICNDFYFLSPLIYNVKKQREINESMPKSIKFKFDPYFDKFFYSLSRTRISLDIKK